jgi:hypothetical protein
MSTELRSRHSAVGSSAAPVVPLDSSEQDRIIREFQLDKLRQDRLWKHFLALLYGGGAILLAAIVACSLMFGCGGRADSPLSGPRCTYFVLPTVLYELAAPLSSSSALISFGVNALLVFALGMVLLWGYYAWRMNECAVQQAFNAGRAARAVDGSRRAESKESQEALLTSSTAAPIQALPIAKGEWRHLRLMQRLATGTLVGWLAFSAAIVAARGNEVGVLVVLFLIGPTSNNRSATSSRASMRIMSCERLNAATSACSLELTRQTVRFAAAITPNCENVRIHKVALYEANYNSKNAIARSCARAVD